MSLLRRRMMTKSGGGGRLPAAYREVEYLFTNTFPSGSYTPNQMILDNKVEDFDKWVMDIKGPLFQHYCPWDSCANRQSLTQGGYPGLGVFSYDLEGNNLTGYSWAMVEGQSFDLRSGIRCTVQCTYSGVTSGKENRYVCIGYSHGTAGTFDNPMYIYSYKAYKNNVLLLELVPCYRKSDNEVGLYDLVAKKFYANLGTGTYLAGGVV